MLLDRCVCAVADPFGGEDWVLMVKEPGAASVTSSIVGNEKLVVYFTIGDKILATGIHFDIIWTVDTGCIVLFMPEGLSSKHREP